MTPYEVVCISQEIDKTEDWTYHRKAMYGIYLMASLTYPNTLEKMKFNEKNFLKEENIRIAVYEIINKLIQFDEIQVLIPKIEEVNNWLKNKYFTQIIHRDVNQCSTYVFSKNIWIEWVDKEETLALVVTGGVKGRFVFKKIDGIERNSYNFFFCKNGVYILPSDILKYAIHVEICR